MTPSSKSILSWFLRCVAAIIMLQTLFFKFTASPESVFIFSSLGIEPWGRILTGVLELIASVLILVSYTTVIGALIAAGIMAGALLSHFFILGISVQNDGGTLFFYGLIVLICSLLLLWIHRHQMSKFLPNRFMPFKTTKA